MSLLIVLKPKKELLILIDNKITRIVIKKVNKDVTGLIKTLIIDLVDKDQSLTILYENLKVVSVPLTSTEFFTMYINWLNFNRIGVHQDLVYAENLKGSILQTIVERDIVIYGDGKFEQYDYNNLKKLTNVKN